MFALFYFMFVGWLIAKTGTDKRIAEQIVKLFDEAVARGARVYETERREIYAARREAIEDGD